MFPDDEDQQYTLKTTWRHGIILSRKSKGWLNTLQALNEGGGFHFTIEGDDYGAADDCYGSTYQIINLHNLEDSGRETGLCKATDEWDYYRTKQAYRDTTWTYTTKTGRNPDRHNPDTDTT